MMDASKRNKIILAVSLTLIVVIILYFDRFFHNGVAVDTAAQEPSVQIEKLLATDDGEFLTLEQEEVPVQSKIAMRVTAKSAGVASLVLRDENNPPRVLISKIPIQASAATLIEEQKKPWVYEIDENSSEMQFCLIFGKNDAELAAELKKFVGDQMANAECMRVVPIQ